MEANVLKSSLWPDQSSPWRVGHREALGAGQGGRRWLRGVRSAWMERRIQSGYIWGTTDRTY